MCLRKAQPIAWQRIAHQIGSSVSEACLLIAGADALFAFHVHEGAFGKHRWEGRCGAGATAILPISASLRPAIDTPRNGDVDRDIPAAHSPPPINRVIARTDPAAAQS